jgi:hypothetical protein
MSQTDWAKTYAAMDGRIILKYEQLPRGEQIGPGWKSGQRKTLIGRAAHFELRMSTA